ncbi:TlpA disulfide reductase family protein [uncultured Clostridium sp.]|uniref:TlpA family protein disulfide reductase n=1 Tax=uncultured Clostridium sp. TaxID=59620 RepID=UPI0026328ECC|nr:TlpA disulfide reductase family protein [uncultured Clostridium sp.]
MKRKIIIALLVILVLIAGTDYFYKWKKEKQQETIKSSQSVGNKLNEDNWNVRPKEFIEDNNKHIEEMKDFTLENLNGEKVSLSQYKGKTIFINFWATWCTPCESELASLSKVYNEYKEDKDIVILTINVGENEKTAKDFMTKNNYSFPVLLDSTGEVAKEYGAKALPISVVINKEGKVVEYKRGAMDLIEMEGILKK